MVGFLSSFQIIDYLQDISTVSLLSNGESQLGELSNESLKIIVDGFKILVKHLVVVSLQHTHQHLNILEISVTILAQSFFVVTVVPSGSNRTLHCHTVFAVLVLKTFVNLLELLFTRLQTIASVSFVLGSV